jgi:hypothetical protein
MNPARREGKPTGERGLAAGGARRPGWADPALLLGPADSRERVPAGAEIRRSHHTRAVAVGVARRPPAQGRVRAHLVVEVDPRADDALGVQPVAELVEVHRLVLKDSAVRPARSSAPAPPGSALEPAPKKIPLDRELPDLRVQVPDPRLVLQRGLAARAPGEHLRQPFEQLPLPCGHLVRMKLVPRGDRPPAVPLAQGLQRHSRLELRREPSSLPGHLGASCPVLESTLTTCPKNRDHLNTSMGPTQFT